MQADSEEVKKKMLEIIYSQEGLTDDNLHREINQHYPLKEITRVSMLQDLIKMGYIRAVRNQRGEVVYYYQNPEDARKLEKLDDNDKIVFQLIQDAKSKGVSKNELKHKSGMNQKVLQTSLKTLDKFGLVKSLKAKDKNRWVFFTHDQEADADVVGGKFYEGGEINSEKINSIRMSILGLVEARGKTSHSETVKHLMDNCPEARDLAESDLASVLQTLVYDDLLEDVSTLGQAEYVKARGSGPSSTLPFISTPCFGCPVFHECKVGE